ncbi:DUF1850 domain-containing protein [Bacillus kexueae]|uniref:DUF1850 domain-containing protein n=1 Tax=Aeribacillus kexueae TaxID=2078952 RepID=UPI001FAF6D9F|nr:DUF1850 domain-containing protein [Bacillus kexueae]
MLHMTKRFFFLPLLIIIIAFVFFFPYRHTLTFYYEDTDQMLAFLPVRELDSFKITYTHSIHLSEVSETFSIENDQLILTELEYSDFAIGMPSNAEGNEVFEKRDGKYVITNMERQFASIDLRIGQVRADHQLVYNGIHYKLADKIGGGKWVRVVPERLSLWHQLKGVNISE